MNDTTALNIAAGYRSPVTGVYTPPASAPAAPITSRIAGAPPGTDLAPGSTLQGSYNYSEPSVISTDSGQKVLKAAIDQHNLDLNNLKSTSANQSSDTGTSTTKTDDNTSWAMKQVGGITADEAKASGIDLTSGYSYDQSSGYFLPTSGTKAQQDQFASDKQTIDNAFSAQLTSMDAATRSLIDSINGIYNDRIAAQMDVNKRELQGFDTMNVRDGTSRYAGGVAQGILTADENVGLDRIRTIAHEQANEIAQANENLTNKKYTAFMDNRAAIDKLTAERNTTLKDLQTKAIAAQTTQNKQLKEAQLGSTIAGLMAKGVHDPSEILKELNGNGGSYSAKDVGDALKSLSPTADLTGLTGATKDFYVLKERGLLPDSVKNLPDGQQLFAYLRQEKQSVTTSKSKNPSVGTNPTSSEVQDATDIFHNNNTKWGTSIMGQDGRVDPYIYRRLYDNWIAPTSQGGLGHTPASFTKNFPIAQYIDPNDMGLPILAPVIPNKKASTSASSGTRKP